MKPSRYFLVTLKKYIDREEFNGLWIKHHFKQFGEIQNFNDSPNTVLITFKNIVVIKQKSLCTENIEVSIQYCTRGFIQNNLIFNAQPNMILAEIKSTTVVRCYRSDKWGYKNRFFLTFVGELPEKVEFKDGTSLYVEPERNKGPDRSMPYEYGQSNNYECTTIKKYNSNDTATRMTDNHRSSSFDPVKERASTSKNPTLERTTTRKNDSHRNSSMDPDKERASTSEIPTPENAVDPQSSIAIDIDMMIDKLKSFKKRFLTSSSSSSSKRPRKE